MTESNRAGTAETKRRSPRGPGLALEEYCREQARLLLEFPECDDACREVAASKLGGRAP